MGQLFDLEASGYFYTRLQTPPMTPWRQRSPRSRRNRGNAHKLWSGGQLLLGIQHLRDGRHVVASSTIYGGTFNLLAHTLLKMGIETTFVSPDCTPDELDAAFRPNTRCVLARPSQTPRSRSLTSRGSRGRACARCAPHRRQHLPHARELPPIEWGADIVTHSTTKYMDGHGVAVGGAIVDSGNFDWMAHAEKFPGLTTPDESYHGIVCGEVRPGWCVITKATSQLMRDFGSIQSPRTPSTSTGSREPAFACRSTARTAWRRRVPDTSPGSRACVPEPAR